MKTAKERFEEIGGSHNIATFIAKQKLPYEQKKIYAKVRAQEFAAECDRRGLNYHVSVGGLDSITLLIFLRKVCHIDCPAVSASHLEDASIRKIHKELGVIPLPSIKDSDGNAYTKARVLQEFGFPVLSKEKAAKIELLQNPTDKNKTVRHAIITGETGEYGGFQKNSRMKLPQKWLEKFGGYENENEGVKYEKPNFKVSAKCCYYLKERACELWAKEHNSVPYLGLMASEGGRREKSLKMHGCNYFGKTTIRSAPFAIFSRQDILQLALELNVPIPKIYGKIENDENGQLYTTGAQRTGCDICGFGIHLEQSPNRFDRLKASNPKAWHFWMYEVCTDEKGEKYGWARVLDYIGVKYEK